MTYYTERNPKKNRAQCLIDHPGMDNCPEGLAWLSGTELDKTAKEAGRPEALETGFQAGFAPVDHPAASCCNTAWRRPEEWARSCGQPHPFLAAGPPVRKQRVNLLALGSVGETVLMGLKLLGGHVISQIGIYDVNHQVMERFEMEMNQVGYPFEHGKLPEVKLLEADQLFDCDVFVFCAAVAVPAVGSGVADVRMAQFEANSKILSIYAKMARQRNFAGLFAVVSDPVDLLCKKAFLASNEDPDGNFDCGGLLPDQIRGYGLGVMNARAAYYAKKDLRFSSFLTEGRAFGPHGKDLVIANSIGHYDDALSRELTKLTVSANLKTRELGYKPYIAPALSSAAISLILTLEGNWHYSAVFLGGVFMGCKNRETRLGLQVEHLHFPQQLYSRLETAYANLEAIL